LGIFSNTGTLSAWIKNKDKILDGDQRYECIKVLLYDFSDSFFYKMTKGNKPSSKFCTEQLAILDLVCKLARVSCKM